MDFYADAMNYPPAAKEFRDIVYEKLQLIGENPYMYGVPDNLPDFAKMGYIKRWYISTMRFCTWLTGKWCRSSMW